MFGKLQLTKWPLWTDSRRKSLSSDSHVKMSNFTVYSTARFHIYDYYTRDENFHTTLVKLYWTIHLCIMTSMVLWPAAALSHCQPSSLLVLSTFSEHDFWTVINNLKENTHWIILKIKWLGTLLTVLWVLGWPEGLVAQLNHLAAATYTPGWCCLTILVSRRPAGWPVVYQLLTSAAGAAGCSG